MRKTLEVLNDLESKGFYRRYAIGGAIAAVFYVDPVPTEDLDVLILLPPNVSLLAPLSDLYAEMRIRGYSEDGPHVIIEGAAVQFLQAYNPLVEEAVEQAAAIAYADVMTRVPSAEHLTAIMIQTGRPKDRIRFQMMLESANLDRAKLDDILSRYDLARRYEAWTNDH
jgi:hypothetical protein